jgi:hypothetical protein
MSWSDSAFAHEVDARMKLAHSYGRCLGAIEVALGHLKYNNANEASEFLKKFLVEIRAEQSNG